MTEDLEHENLNSEKTIIYKNQIHDEIVNYMRLMPVSLLINVRDLFKEIYDMKMDYLDFLKERKDIEENE